MKTNVNIAEREIFDKAQAILDAWVPGYGCCENRYIRIWKNSNILDETMYINIGSRWRQDQVYKLKRTQFDQATPNKTREYTLYCYREGKWLEYLDILYKRALDILTERKVKKEAQRKIEEEKAFSRIDDSKIMEKAIANLEKEIAKEKKKK